MGFIDMEDKGNKGSSISKGSSKIIEISCPQHRSVKPSYDLHSDISKYPNMVVLSTEKAEMCNKGIQKQNKNKTHRKWENLTFVPKIGVITLELIKIAN